jgi:hypothetical protein
MGLSSTMVVKRRNHRTEFSAIQVLLREWRLGGLTVFTEEIDREEVPAWALIQVGALGYTDWRSKFAEHIK